MNNGLLRITISIINFLMCSLILYAEDVDVPIKICRYELKSMIPCAITHNSITDNNSIVYQQADTIEVIEVTNKSKNVCWIFFSQHIEDQADDVLINRFRGSKEALMRWNNVYEFANIDWTYSLYPNFLKILKQGEKFTFMISPFDKTIGETLISHLKYKIWTGNESGRSYTLDKISKLPEDSPYVYPANCMLINVKDCMQ